MKRATAVICLLFAAIFVCRAQTPDNGETELYAGDDLYPAGQPGEAFGSWMAAAEKGNANAQFNVGCCYENALGVERDDAKAVKWYRLSAEQGDEKALKDLKTIAGRVKRAEKKQQDTKTNE
jgi:TPR repeat protein